MIRAHVIICLLALSLSSCSIAPIASGPSLAGKPTAVGASDEELARAAREALGDREGAVIVIDPQNGRLRTVINPRLAFEQSFPPGSAIKPFTALAALRAGLLRRETSRLCRSRYVSEGFAIVCSHPRSDAPFDLPHALAYSCNYYFAHIGERLSQGAFVTMLDNFGFGARTGLDAGEEAGSLPRGEWQVRAALGESDSFLVTPIQLLTAYTALVNGGRLFHPRLGGEGREAARLNIVPQHRAALIEGMRGAVKYGTAAGMKPGESYIFGKTGTSTSSNGFRTQGWFVGFLAQGSTLPREDQVRLGVLVFLKRSHGAECAEVAGKIFECGLRIADCGFKREVLNKPQHVIPAGYINSQSAIRIPHSIRVRSVGENITRELPLEEYLVGVLRGEAASEDEFEALKAQAVISRTFALKNLGRHAGEGFDFCSTTHCQRFLYSDKRSPSPIRRAVYETAGEVLRDELGCLVDGYFHAACGGVTANIRALWGVPAPSYLRGVRDDFCETMPHRRWTQTIPAVDLVKALSGDERTNVGPRLDAIVVSKRDATGRAEMLTLSGVRSRVVRGWDFKIIVGRSLGWQKIKSSRFAVTRSGSDFVFRGSGFGHGLGLCQEGAHVMASRGMNYRQILDHYFPGTRSAVSSFQFPVSSKSGFRFLNWKLETGNWKLIASEHFRASFQGEREPVESALRILEASHSDLLQRLRQASLQLAEPRPFEVVIHATTADFIASTGQSGWAAGVTRGRRIELQPLALLRKRGILTQTLRHELAHAVIEVLSEGRAPRWLSEGLAIHLSGEGAALSRSDFRQQLARAQLERKLARPAPAKVMRELYAAAYREVLALIRAEGEENVWRLVAGAKNASPDKDNVDKVMNGDDEEEVAKKAVPTGSSRSLEELADEELRCVQCGAPVPDVACGRVMPCRSCGYQYPLGDCSDYAEN